MAMTIPLFPLNTVLFPGGVLPLRIFEPRYLDMVSDSLKNETGIGVVLIRDGEETGNAADTCEIGTLSRISYWHKRADGILGITLRGEQRFRILSRQVTRSQLILAEVELLEELPATDVPEDYQHMVLLLQQIIKQLGPPYSTMPADYQSADWVSARLVEILPLQLTDKQDLLATAQTSLRFSRLDELLRKIDS